MKRVLFLATAAVALSLLVGAPAAYAASTLYVNAATGTDSSTCGTQVTPCATIGQAVDNASAGDTIEVAAGTYDESPNIDKSLTLDGAQARNAGSAARASESPTSESVVTGGTLYINADNVTVDGFSFGYAGNQVFTAFAKSTIEDNVFSGYQPAGYYDSALGATSAPDAHVVHNYFTSPTADLGDYGGAVVQWSTPGNCSGVHVSDNIFDNASASDLSDIYFFCQGTPGQATVEVSGNHDLENHNSFAIFQTMGGPVDVTNNTVSMEPDAGTGMIFDDDPNMGAVVVSGNMLTGSPYRAVKIAEGNDCCGFAGPAPGPFTLTGNDFSGNGVGVWAGAGALAADATVTLRANNLSGESGDNAGDAAAGVYNDPSSGATVDAIDNWWGCNTGPSTPGCSQVSGAAVTFDPWLVLGISASPSTLPAGGSSTMTADVTHDSAGLDTSAEGTILDGTAIGFATDFGTLSTSSAPTSGGRASVLLTSPTAGTANVSATLDSQTVSTAVTFTPNLPTTMDQCKKGGWRSFGIFKNQGDCVSYVATLGRNPGSGG